MTRQTKTAPLGLCSWHYQNWLSEAEPPAVLNPRTTLHAAIAWAWGEIAMLDDVCAAGIDDPESLLATIQARLPVICALLEQLGKRTRHMTDVLEAEL